MKTPKVKQSMVEAELRAMNAKVKGTTSVTLAVTEGGDFKLKAGKPPAKKEGLWLSTRDIPGTLPTGVVNRFGARNAARAMIGTLTSSS